MAFRRKDGRVWRHYPSDFQLSDSSHCSLQSVCPYPLCNLTEKAVVIGERDRGLAEMLLEMKAEDM
jgi:hypothetical protein